MANIGYQTRTTDVGRLLFAAGDDGLCLLEFDSDFGVQESLDMLERSGADLAEGGAAVDQATREVDAYLGGRLETFSIPVDLCLARPFARRVLKRLMSVGFGQLTTYGELARARGDWAQGGRGSRPLQPRGDRRPLSSRRGRRREPRRLLVRARFQASFARNRGS